MKKLFLLVALIAAQGCSSTGSDGGGTGTPKVCTPGQTNACVCSSGAAGAQECRDDGSGYSACECASGSDAGSSVVDTGPACSGISGTYACTRKRSTTSPGSCSPTYVFNGAMPLRIAADVASASGYKVEVGYTNNDTGETVWINCTNNVSACQIFATCELATAKDEVTLTISGNTVTGTISRTDSAQKCSIAFTVAGTRT